MHADADINVEYRELNVFHNLYTYLMIDNNDIIRIRLFNYFTNINFTK